MEKTEYYALNKPGENDYVDIMVLNANMDIIDAQLKGNEENISTKQPTITVSGILKGDGSGGISAAAAGTDYVLPSGSITGNAATATKLVTSRTIALSGDATASGSFNGSANLTLSTTLANSGVTAGSYGPSANASPAHAGTFSVPYLTVDAKGRVTAASTKTITLPSDSNTDTKVTQTVTTTDAAYPLLTAATASKTATSTEAARFASGVTLNPSTKTITATTFSGALSGNASTATKLATARTIRTNLASTSTASFDGTANVTPGVTGTLPVANGGTGKTSYTANRLIYPSAATTLTQLAFPSVAGSVLRQGKSGAPYWTSLADLAAALGTAAGAARIETGSYVGTGTYGSDNPNSLTFGFVPKFVIVREQDEGRADYNIVEYIKGLTGSSGGSSAEHLHFTLSGTTLSWYAPNGGIYYQGNVNGTTYLYFALG